MNRAATHQGECQACGRRQKLPGGVLAKHGYTKRWGFFSGVCPGSDELPFEQSSALVERFIAQAEQQIVMWQKEYDDAHTMADAVAPEDLTAKAWIRIYDSRNYTYRIELCEIRATIHVYAHGNQTYRTFEFLNQRGGLRSDTPTWQTINVYGVDSNNMRAVVTYLNHHTRIPQVTAEMSQRQQYIAWQRERLAGWAPKPLVPLAGKAAA